MINRMLGDLKTSMELRYFRKMTIITYEMLGIEHRNLIDQLNNLTVAKDGLFSSAQVAVLQTDFRVYCRHEEEAMSAANYPYVYAHILAHTIAAKYFLRLLMSDGGYLASDLIADIVEHINTYDAQFIDYCEALSKQ